MLYAAKPSAWRGRGELAQLPWSAPCSGPNVLVTVFPTSVGQAHVFGFLSWEALFRIKRMLHTHVAQEQIFHVCTRDTFFSKSGCEYGSRCHSCPCLHVPSVMLALLMLFQLHPTIPSKMPHVMTTILWVQYLMTLWWTATRDCGHIITITPHGHKFSAISARVPVSRLQRFWTTSSDAVSMPRCRTSMVKCRELGHSQPASLSMQRSDGDSKRGPLPGLGKWQLIQASRKLQSPFSHRPPWTLIWNLLLMRWSFLGLGFKRMSRARL